MTPAARFRSNSLEVDEVGAGPKVPQLPIKRQEKSYSRTEKGSTRSSHAEFDDTSAQYSSTKVSRLYYSFERPTVPEIIREVFEAALWD